MSQLPDYYLILGVREDASTEEIIRAYRALLRRIHPDVNKAADAHAKTVEANEAVEVLRNPEARRQYDLARQARVKQNASYDGVNWDTQHRSAKVRAEGLNNMSYADIAKRVEAWEAVINFTLQSTETAVRYAGRKLNETTYLLCGCFWALAFFVLYNVLFALHIGPHIEPVIIKNLGKDYLMPSAVLLWILTFIASAYSGIGLQAAWHKLVGGPN